jgi:hypothetical protein
MDNGKLGMTSVIYPPNCTGAQPDIASGCALPVGETPRRLRRLADGQAAVIRHREIERLEAGLCLLQTGMGTARVTNDIAAFLGNGSTPAPPARTTGSISERRHECFVNGREQ